MTTTYLTLKGVSLVLPDVRTLFTNLSVPSAEALEMMLSRYQSVSIVVAHDDIFLNNLGLTDRLVATEEGWHMEAL
ncbi:hypothetical protein [Marinimicrobium agarilyticum]|uniref:hypothetical protein n=1 Tax=Marinimicrobium agarilyticum TaxID=306546 RepID=UPI0003FD9710|nr:hypothetical protein [Marinimicrobium agarilyticum]